MVGTLLNMADVTALLKEHAISEEIINEFLGEFLFVCLGCRLKSHTQAKARTFSFLKHIVTLNDFQNRGVLILNAEPTFGFG